MFDFSKHILKIRQLIRYKILFAVLACMLLAISCDNTVKETNTNLTNSIPKSSGTKSINDIDKTIIENNFEHVTTLSKTAASFDITSGTNNEIYAALKEDYDLFVRHSTNGGLSFDPPIQSNEKAVITGLAPNRPAIAATDNGSVAVTWTSGQEVARVWYALSQDHGKTFDRSFILSHRNPKPSTGFPEISFDNNKNPVTSWIQEGGIRVSQSFDGGETFSIESGVDAEVSSCTKTSITSTENDYILVAYRDRELLDNKPIRPIKLGISSDFGQIFGTRQLVSKTPWDIKSCPDASPSIQSYKNNIYIVWMDGGIVENASFTNIWLAKSTLNSQHYTVIKLNNATERHSHPSITVSPNGVIHIIWASREPNKAIIKYVSSKDSINFSSPVNIVSSNDGTNRRAPSHPSIISDKSNNIYVGWSDALGTHIGQLKNTNIP